MPEIISLRATRNLAAVMSPEELSKFERFGHADSAVLKPSGEAWTRGRPIVRSMRLGWPMLSRHRS